MISKEEWDDAYHKLIADGRSRAGAPPTFEEVEALSRGDLSEAEAERLREALSCYPDLLRVYTEPFPADAEGVLTEEEIVSDLAKLRERVRRPAVAAAAPIVMPSRRRPARTFALAAGILIAAAIGGITIRRLTIVPRPTSTQMLYPEGVRGGSRGGEAPVTLSDDRDYELQLVYESRKHFSEYRLEMIDLSTDPARRVWLREHLPRRVDDTFAIRLNTADLEPRLYHLALYGSGTTEPLAEYTIRITRN